MASNEFPVAVIGIACRVPHCENASQFWQFIRNKQESVGKFPSNRAEDIDHVLQTIGEEKLAKPKTPFFTGSFFDSIDKFDAQFFGISPQEAKFIDPQQRFFLRTAWEAFEDAGIASQVYGSDIGVYVGNANDKYAQVITESHPSTAFGTHAPFIASRLSYTFDLRGPAFLVGIGCSSSLLAVHLACQALKNGDCKTAIAGGVTLDCLPINLKSDVWNLLDITAEDVRCCPFDDNAKGTVKGEGCAAVVLKPLSDAIEDGNHIYGVIVGSATNQNGRGNGLSTPHPRAQCDVMVNAWQKADLNPNDIDYFETHGTGTMVGDPIEMMGIQMAFDRLKTKRTQNGIREKPCLGSVKANIGHLADGAAGVIGLIKVLLALEYESIPPQINFNNPNVKINWNKSPFRINTESVNWRATNNKSRVAAISSFGFVGTNVHLVVRDYKRQRQTHDDDYLETLQPILISATTQSSLKMFIEHLRSYLQSAKNSQSPMFFKDLAYTLNVGRDHTRFHIKSLIFADNVRTFDENLQKLLHYLNSKHVTPVTFADEDVVKEALVKEGFLCFTVDSTTKIKPFEAKESNQPFFSSFLQLFTSIVNKEQILWRNFEKRSRAIVPLLPAYCFNEERFWPNLQKTRRRDSNTSSITVTSMEDYYSLSDEKNSNVNELTLKNFENEFRQMFTKLVGLNYDDWELYKQSTLVDLNIDVHVMVEIIFSMSKSFQTNINFSAQDLQFNSTVGEILELVKQKLIEPLKQGDSINGMQVVSVGVTDTVKTGDLFLNFEIQEENVKNIERLCQKNVRLIKHSPHTVVQSILQSKDNGTAHFQLLILTDELDDSYFNQLSQVLKQTDELLRTVPLIIIQLRLSPENSKSNYSEKLQLKFRRIFLQTYDIPSKYHMLSFAKNHYNVPFNIVGYEYISSLVGRAIRAALFPSKLKVIAVDADNTLWKGECSNERVVVEEHHRFLQKFLIEKYEKGYLLVLLSKNTENDIQSVFRTQKDDFLVTLEHFVEKRVNWSPKHENLSDICNQLKLNTESVVFIDDNIHECLSMVTQHASVLCLCFPSTLNATRGMLDNIWALDSFDTTSDSRRRSVYYRQEINRKETLKQQSLNEVLHSWQMILKCFTAKIAFIKCDYIEAFNRSQELLNRTNQFKMNSYVVDMLAYSDCKCLIFSLEDKFGSSGIVSVVIFKIESGAVLIEQWVMSCRALGRHVEHNILRHLQKIGKRFNCDSIRIKFNRTEKNDPAFNFLQEAKFTETGCSNGIKWMSSSTVDLPDCVSIQVLQVDSPEMNDNNEDEVNSIKTTKRDSDEVDSSTDFKQNIDACKHWIQTWPKELKSQPKIDCLNPALIEKLDEVELMNNEHEDSVLMKSWCEILGSRPTDKSHFFQSGGTSFKAVYFISKLREEIELDIRLSHIYQHPTFGEIRCLLKSLDSLKRLIPSDVDSKEFKLSSLQNAFLMLQQVSHFSTAYTENVAVFGFFEDFNSEVILKKVLEQYPFLTSVVDENENRDKIMSRLTEEEIIRSSILESVSVATKEAAICKARDLRPYFTLKSRESLIKLLVIEISNDFEANKMIVLYIHHILIDDVSLSDLELCLQQILLNNCITRRQVLKGYDECSRNEHLYLNSEECERDLETIAKCFETVPPNTTLGFSSEIWSDTKIYDCESKYFEIELNIEDVCRELNIRPFHYFVSCYLLTLKRYAAENDLLISIPITTRSHAFENALGPFVNIVLFRYQIDPESDIKTFMQSVASEWLKTQDINHLPLDKVLSYLRDKKKIANIPLSNVFNYSALTRSESSVYIPPLHAKAPLYLSVKESKNNRVNITIEWTTAFVDSDIVDNFSKSFVNVCKQIANNLNEMKSETVSRIDLMSTDEYKTILDFNRPLHGIPNTFAHRYFERHCSHNENKVAINFGDRSITYKQLNTVATKIAVFLQQTVKKEDLQKKPIVVMMERNEMVIASILAIWKVGGFFLTISEDMQQRVLQIDGDGKVTFDLILTNLSPEQIYVDIPRRVSVANVNEIIRENSTEFKDSLNQRNPETTFAYMFLTSGTTGEPKRSMITHQALNIFIEGCLKDYELEKFNVSLMQWLPICFDAFVHELVVGILSVGGSITIVPQKHRFDVAKIGQLMEDHKISCCLVTPQFASSLVSELPQKSLKHFRMLIVGGDVFYQNVYQELCSKLGPETKIINVYGMTETTIDSTFFTGSLNYLTSSAQVPIGKPIVGVKMFIVDPISKLLSPIGTVGEICISGLLVGKGDIKTTKLSFTGDDPVFMTGDKARWLPDGNIDFIGRKTSTFFKMRGFRVNPREIELVVIKNIGNKIDQILVFAAEDRFGQSILCLVYKPKCKINGSNMDNEIRNVIKSRLPYYMFPNVVKSLNEIPLTKNGKTDLNSLRKLCVCDEPNNSEMENLDTNLSPTESMLVKYLMSSMSSSAPIDVNLNFRDQGIHSLTLVKFANIMLNDKVPGFKGVVDLFDYPNIKLLSQNIDAYHVTVEPKIIPLPQNDDCKVAVVGVAFRLPRNITSITELKHALQEQRCLIDEFPESRSTDYLTRLDNVDFQRIRNIKKFKGAFLDSIDKFDNEYFDISPTEAKHMCPEQRLWMEVATEALADSGHINTVRGSNFGIFMSKADVKYDIIDSSNESVSVVGKNPAFIPTRTAYHFDMKGPAVVVDTACSSGIVALHQACEAIKLGNCDAAIVGGLNIILYPAKDGIFGDKMSTQSSDACCRAFDEKANGTVPGEGVIAFVVEPLQKAIDNNRFIYGVIESTAVNSVGRGNGITAPSVVSQKEVITSALNTASLSPRDIKLIEAHGSGTQLGDTIELTALKEIFGDNSNPLFVCATKSSFGHLDGASGLLGILKLLTTLVTQEIPPAVNFKTPNLALQNSNLLIPTKAVKLGTSEISGGVSSFGLSGTNSHVILSREAKHQRANDYLLDSDLMSHPLLISCYSFDELHMQIDHYYNYINLMVIQHKITNIAEICATVCRKLKNTAKKRKRGENIRIVLMLENEEQSLKLLSKMRTIGRNELKRLSDCDPNVIVSVTGDNEFIDDFIEKGYIQNDIIDTFKELKNSPCLPLSIFQPIRHWPEERSQSLDNIIPTTHSKSSVNIKSLIEKQILEVRELVHAVDLKPKDAVQETIDRFAVAYIAQFFREASFAQYWKVGKTFETYEFFEKTGIHEHYFSLFRTLLKHLSKCGIIRSNKVIYDNLPVNFTILVDLNDERMNEDPETIANYGIDSFPNYQDCFKLPFHCMKYFKEVLLGNLSPLTVLYPKGDLGFTSRHEMIGDPLGSIYMRKNIQTIAKYVKKLARQSNKKIRVLEAGAGLGLITRQLASKFADLGNVEYWFTDIGNAFVNYAEKVFSLISSKMQFRVFDITKPAEEQGIHEQFDIIVAYNVVHVTESLLKTCGNLCSTLNDTGVMFILENTRNNIWATLTWGILDGWWLFKDYELRSEVLCTADNWERTLRKVDFKTVYSCPTNKEEREFVEKFMFVCCKENFNELENVNGWWEKAELRFEDNLLPHKPSGPEKRASMVKMSYEEIVSVLRDIWKSVLGVEEVKEDDIFRELGGESLLAIQMMFTVNDEIGVELELAHCYAYPSLKELANFIKTLLDEYPEGINSKDQSLHPGYENETMESSNEVEKPVLPEPENTNDALLMFCGQGAQKETMFNTLLNDAKAHEVFEEAKRILGIDILRECRTKESLQQTKFVQIALFVGSIAKIKQIENEKPQLLQNVKAVAGLSVGEFAALTYSGVLSFSDALRLVYSRGIAMQDSVDTTPTAMTSILGPNSKQLTSFLETNFPKLYVSGYLADNQHTVSGDEFTIDEFLSKLTDKNVTNTLKIADARKLRVSGAFHTKYMQSAAFDIDSIINSINFKRPKIPVILNVNGKATTDPEFIKSQVKHQLVSALQWRQTVITAVEMGMKNFIELSPSPILTAIIRKRIKECMDANCTATFVEI